jgi:membrane protein required for colicin V production
VETTVTFVNAVLIGLLIFGTIAGMVKGMVRQVIELLGVIAAFLAALLFASWLATLLQEFGGLPYSPALVIAFVLLFLGGMVTFHFLGKVVHNLIHLTFLGWVDRFAGGALGLIIAMLIGSALLAVVLELPVSKDVREGIEQAEVSMFLQPMAPALFDFVFEHGDGGIATDKILRRGESI